MRKYFMYPAHILDVPLYGVPKPHGSLDLSDPW